MKKSKLTNKYIIFSIILYVVGVIILSILPDQISSGSEMFSGLRETLYTMMVLVIIISISELIGGIYLLIKNVSKKMLKRALILSFLLIIGSSLIFYPFSLVLIIFIIPISSIIINCSVENKKYIKIIFLLMFLLLLVRVILQISDYINFVKRENSYNDLEYPCGNYLVSNYNDFYCFSTNQIKKINKNSLNKKIYNKSNYLFNGFLDSINFIENTSNNNFIYYTIYKMKYGSIDANYELHVIDINNDTDTVIINLKKEVIASAITDESGNLFFTSEKYNGQVESYYYQSSNNKLIKINRSDLLDYYYLNNNKLYYSINDGDYLHYYSYDILKRKKTDGGYINNDPNVTMNSVFININNYRYQFYNNEIYKYDINDYLKKTVIKTDQDYRINDIKISNDKIYYFHIDNNLKILLGYYDINSDLITNINYVFKGEKNNYILFGDDFYYISSDDEHLYKYNLNNKNIEEFLNIKVKAILGIDMDTIYLKTMNNDYEAINLYTKKIILDEK
ncbi:MAG: CPBP family intramembrane metalloprotease [Bacilli bacterium]|nr:CPBP family intramembrane metalloprotease [Bacilli bacterium]